MENKNKKYLYICDRLVSRLPRMVTFESLSGCSRFMKKTIYSNKFNFEREPPIYFDDEK